MKDCGGHFHGKHLKRSLDYVMNPEKTQDGRRPNGSLEKLIKGRDIISFSHLRKMK